MKTAFTLEAEARDSKGKGAARELRRQGRVPAVLYGKGQEPLSFSLDQNTFMNFYQKGGLTNKLVEIKLGGKGYHVLPREIQTHPVSDLPEHLDFMVVDANSRVKVAVPVRLINTEKCAGIKMGGALNVVRHEIDLICAPDAIPPVIKIDVLDLAIGDSLHISQVELPKGVTPAVTDRDFTIITVVGRNTKEDAAEDAADAAGATAASAAAAPAAEGGAA